MLFVVALWLQMPPQSHVLQEGFHPTPFSAEQIRSASVEGHCSILLMHPMDGDAFLTKVIFRGSDPETAVFESQNYDLEGNPMGAAQTGSASWADLQGHASFPIQSTELSEETIDSVMGKKACWKYVVKNAEGSETFWFAKDHPGPPIKLVSQRGELTQTSMQMLMIGQEP